MGISLTAKFEIICYVRNRKLISRPSSIEGEHEVIQH